MVRAPKAALPQFQPLVEGPAQDRTARPDHRGWSLSDWRAPPL